MTAKVESNPFIWWELRRIPFNVLFLIGAELSVQLIYIFVEVGPMEEAIHPFTMMAILIVLNVLYTLSWISEIGNRRTHNRRLTIFKWVLGISIGFIMIPPAIHFFPFVFRQLCS
ncbi:MAG: hypothetical protein AAF391_11425 [Bacteroidota bacterium]